MSKLSFKNSANHSTPRNSSLLRLKAKHFISLIPVLGLSAIFASDIAERAEKAINELGALDIESFDKGLSTELANDLEEILKMQNMSDSPQVKISDLRLKVRTLEAEIEQSRSGGPKTSMTTVKSLMDKNDELRRLKSELRKLETENGIEPSLEELPPPDVNKLNNSYKQMVEERNQMEKELFEMKKKQKEMAYQIRSDKEREYLESLNQGTGTISSIPTQPAKAPSPSMPSIPEPNPYIKDDTLTGLESFLQSEGVLDGPSAPQTVQTSGSKFSGLLDDDPISQPDTYQPLIPRNPVITRNPAVSPIASPSVAASTARSPQPVLSASVTNFQFVPPVDSQPVTTSASAPLFFSPPLVSELPAPQPVSYSNRRIRPELASPEDQYDPEVPDILLRSQEPTPSFTPPRALLPSVASPVPTNEPPRIVAPRTNSMEELLGTISPPPIDDSLPAPEPNALPTRTFGVSEPKPALPSVAVVEPLGVDDEALFGILGDEPGIIETIGSPAIEAEPPTLFNETPLADPVIPSIPEPVSDFSIFDDPLVPEVPEVDASPSTLEQELATYPVAVPSTMPRVEEYQPAPVIVTPPVVETVPVPEESIPDTLEFYDLSSLETSVRSIEENPSNSTSSENVTPETTETASGSTAVKETTPPAIKQPQRQRVVRTHVPSKTVSLQIETLVEKLAGGPRMPADYTEFYITTADLNEIILNSPELKEVMDKAITGKDISSYAELWARAQKYGYNYPGLASMIRQTLRKNGIHRIRTNANGTARLRIASKLLEPGQPEVYFITGVAMLGKVGVVWSKPFYIEDHAGQDNPVLLENADALWLE